MDKREIKFRAWHPPITDGEVTLPGHMDYELEHRKYLAVRTETQAIPASFGFEHVQSGSYFINEDLKKYGERLMQYTGLKDKNGKEIWEGDVVKFPRQWWTHGDKEFHIEEIKFGNGTFSFFNSGDWSVESDEMEVLGNIYENPELLATNIETQ